MAGQTAVNKAPQAAGAPSTPMQRAEGTLHGVELGREGTMGRAVAVSINSVSVQKRKREGPEPQGPATGDGSRRGGAKRVAANDGTAIEAGNVSTGELKDPVGAALMAVQPVGAQPEAGMENNQAAQSSSSNSLDFVPLSEPGHTDQTNAQVGTAGGSNQADAANAAVAALAGIFPTMTVPQSTDLAFANNPAVENERTMDGSFAVSDDSNGEQHGTGDNAAGGGRSSQGPGGRRSSNGESGGGRKLAVGSDEWHRVRRDNHKEVERRRRETINEGINEIAKIVPGCEKNKGAILQRAVHFITQLKENETQNIEKWTLEKLLTEQAITELSANADKAKADLARAKKTIETLTEACEKAGVAHDDADVPGAENNQEGET